MVKSVKYFRHPPLMIWTIVVILLTTLVVAAYKTGSDNTKELAVHTSALEDERPYVAAVLTRVSQIRALSSAKAGDLNQWGQDTADFAMENAIRRAKTAGSEDPVALAYAAIAVDAQNIAAVDEEDAAAVVELQAKIGINYDRLSAASSGVFVPGLSDAPIKVTTGDNNTQTEITLETKPEGK